MRINYKIYLVTIFICFLFFNVRSQNNSIETSGDVLFYAMPTSAVLTTLIKKDKQGTIQFSKGFVTNLALTLGLKAIIDKNRPDLSDNDSFPSGHTSTTFQTASFLQKRYGWKLGLPAYILASYTGFSRIYADKHDGWDVLAGAVIGIGSSYIFTTPYQQEHMDLSFRAGDGNYLLGFTYKF